MQFVLQEDIKISFCQTYVIQVIPKDYEKVAKWACAQMGLNLVGAYANIYLENENYVLITFTSAFKKEFRYQKIQEELKNTTLKQKSKYPHLQDGSNESWDWATRKKIYCNTSKIWKKS